MRDVLEHIERQGKTLKDEDIARLSPLSHKHVNMLGHYSFTLTKQVLNGELRPLKQPSDQEDFA